MPDVRKGSRLQTSQIHMRDSSPVPHFKSCRLRVGWWGLTGHNGRWGGRCRWRESKQVERDMTGLASFLSHHQGPHFHFRPGSVHSDLSVTVAWHGQ